MKKETWPFKSVKLYIENYCILIVVAIWIKKIPNLATLLLSSTERLQKSAVTPRPQRHFSNLKNEKYVDRRSNGVITGQKDHKWALKILLSVVYFQLMFDKMQKDHLTKHWYFLAGIELKKEHLLEKIELSHLF